MQSHNLRSPSKVFLSFQGLGSHVVWLGPMRLPPLSSACVHPQSVWETGIRPFHGMLEGENLSHSRPGKLGQHIAMSVCVSLDRSAHKCVMPVLFRISMNIDSVVML